MFRPVDLPGVLTLIPGNNLAANLGEQARSHPGIPMDPGRVVGDFQALARGVPASFTEPRAGGSGQPAILLYTNSYTVRLTPTKYQQGYLITAVNPRRLRDHHQLARGCLLLRPRGWALRFDPRQLAPTDRSYWDVLLTQWARLRDDLAARYGAPPLSPAHTAFLDRLDRLINATREITMNAVATTPPFPYRAKRATGERRHGTFPVYTFELVGARTPHEGDFVKVLGQSWQRGQVSRIEARSVTVRFDDPVDWAHLPDQGELELTPSDVVFDKQHEAVALLRDRQSHNPGLLTVAVDHRVRSFRPANDEPTEELDQDGQLLAFHKALTVPDMLLILGPPGTGKTRTIRQIASACAAVPGRGRVLIASRTHRAVDNVLAELPPGLVVIRVGNEGKVTAGGERFLLERQATELRTRILRNVGPTLHRYDNVDLARQWSAELNRLIDELLTARQTASDAVTELDAARRAADPSATARVTRCRAELDRSTAKLRRHRARTDRLTRRRERAKSRRGVPVLGALFGGLAGIWGRRLDNIATSTQPLLDRVSKARGDLTRAERDLDMRTRDHPTVRPVRANWEQLNERQKSCCAAALRAAFAAREAARGLGELPQVGDHEDDAATVNDLLGLRSWFDQHLPLLAARAKVLTDWRDAVSGATDQLHPELIRYADVVASTCIGAASRPELSDRDLEFDVAIIDEAGQIGFADILVPLVRARRAVLVGDHRQLPPFLDTDVADWGTRSGDAAIPGLLRNSALEELVSVLPSTNVVPLTQQRRMPADIANFISAAFYDNQLVTKVRREHCDPVFGHAMAFIDTSALPATRRQETRRARRGESTQGGYVNQAEAELLSRLAAFYQRRGTEWALVLPYTAQVEKITDRLGRLIGDSEAVRANVGTVDSFQGGERDVILYGFTRSNPDGRIGFLDELRRANVAFTRAKQQLVLVGDLSTLTVARDAGFRDLATSLRDYVIAHGEIRRYEEVAATVERLDREYAETER